VPATFRTTRFLTIEGYLPLTSSLYTVLQAHAGLVKKDIGEVLADLYQDIIAWPGVAEKEPDWTPQHTLQDLSAWIGSEIRRIDSLCKTADIALIGREHGNIEVAYQCPSPSLRQVHGMIDVSWLPRIYRHHRRLFYTAIDLLRTVFSHVNLSVFGAMDELYMDHLQSILDDDHWEDDAGGYARYNKLYNSYEKGRIHEYGRLLTRHGATGSFGHEYDRLRAALDSCYTGRSDETKLRILEFLEKALVLLGYDNLNLRDVNNWGFEDLTAANEDARPIMPEHFLTVLWGKTDYYLEQLMDWHFEATMQEDTEYLPTLEGSLRGLTGSISEPEGYPELAAFLSNGNDLIFELNDIRDKVTVCSKGFKYNYKTNTRLYY